jgi:hypothetical protein
MNDEGLNAEKSPEPGKIDVPVLDLPSREERRSIIQTGKGLDGTPVHPESRKNLRVAVIADLKAFGAEVNKANAALNKKVDDSFKIIADEMSLGFTEVNWNFTSFLSFLGTLGIMPSDFLTKYEEFKKKSEEELMKAAEVILKKQEEEKVKESKTQEKIDEHGKS